MIEIKKAALGTFEDAYPLLHRFRNPSMGREDWRRMLFAYPWPAGDEPRGYIMYDEGVAVGFIGTIFSVRVVHGRRERFANVSSWIVLESHRSSSLTLLAPILRLKSHTVVNTTPSPAAYEIFTACGYQQLEDRVLLLPPLATPRELLGLRHASMTTVPEEVRADLAGEERRYFDDHQRSRAGHILLRRGGRCCWAVATPMRFKRVLRFALVQHASDWQLLWECLALAKWGFFKALGIPALAVDSRFAEGQSVGPALKVRQRRLYRPARRDIGPRCVDGLYSELMGLRA